MLCADDFSGTWQLRRTIADALTGQDGVLLGQAVFAATQDTRLAYSETGLLKFGSGPQMPASRKYTWAFGAGGVQVFFEDGRPFHDFIPEGHATGTDHPCGQDFYTVRYDFGAWPCWTAVWTVKGPRKDYVSSSVYTR